MWGIFGDMLGRSGAKSAPLDVASCSEQGLVRPDNQDSLLTLDERLTYCVADGMGGGEGGAKASSIVCESVRRAAMSRDDFAERVRAVDDAVKKANAEIRLYARQMGYRQMATTATIVMVDGSDATEAVVGYVGDSRVYRHRAGRLAQVTRDHTLAEEVAHMAKLGVTLNVSGRANRLSHILTRAVGVEDEVSLDWRRIDLKEGDCVIVCSDGLYDVVTDRAMSDAIAEGGAASDILGRLCALVVEGGAIDNYTMIVMKAGGVS